MKTISQISEFLNLETQNESKVQIKSLSLDSRKCDAKTVFIATKGSSADGNDYIQDILEKGVHFVLTDNCYVEKEYKLRDSASECGMVAVIYAENLKEKLADLAQWFYDYEKPKQIIGVTGTNGKTSISSYIAQLLNFDKQNSLLLGTNGNGIYPNLEESTHTTLDVLSLYAKIAEFQGDSGSVSGMTKKGGHSEFDSESLDNIVMEVSSHSLDQNRIAGLEFDVAIFSNISHDHLDYHGTMENYFLAKAKLFQRENLQKAVINIDDKYGRKLCELSQAKGLVKVSQLDKNADIYIEKKNISAEFTVFDLYLSGKKLGEYQTKLIGEFNLMNLALSLGAMSDIKKTLKNIAKVEPVKGRMEKISLQNGATVIIDYAHTPDALEKALRTLQEYKENRLWCMFGCGGNRDKTKRAEMAKIAEQNADLVVVTEDNNRFEAIVDIFQDINKGFDREQIFIFSREKAIRYILKNSKKGDIVLLAGKGHECYMDINGEKSYFDEREIVAKYNR